MAHLQMDKNTVIMRDRLVNQIFRGLLPHPSIRNRDYYFTQREWDRVVGYGKVPKDRMWPREMTNQRN
jgi:hypothetical protein